MRRRTAGSASRASSFAGPPSATHGGNAEESAVAPARYGYISAAMSTPELRASSMVLTTSRHLSPTIFARDFQMKYLHGQSALAADANRFGKRRHFATPFAAHVRCVNPSILAPPLSPAKSVRPSSRSVPADKSMPWKRPRRPAASPARRVTFIFSSSAAVGARSASPSTASRTCAAPTYVPRLIGVPVCSQPAEISVQIGPVNGEMIVIEDWFQRARALVRPAARRFRLLR